MNLFGNKKINAFGLDISDMSIKVMQLTKKGGILYPKSYSDVSLGANMIANHMIINQSKLAENIKRAIAAAGKIDTNYVIASVPEAKSYVRTFSLPKMSDDELDGAIPFELEQDIPVPIDQVYLDWQMIREESDKLHLLVTATDKDYVDTLVETLKQAKLKPIAFELESQATARALVGKDDIDKSLLILDMSTNQTSFIIVENGNLEYTSSIPIAGNAFTESIARNLGIPSPEAEKLKQEVGLTSDTKRGNVRQAILPILDNVVDEIKNIARFYEEHSLIHSSITKILLCGGSAKLLGVADYLSARLNLGAGKPMGDVVLANPWINLSKNPKDKGPMSDKEALEYATVTGLAMRGIL